MENTIYQKNEQGYILRQRNTAVAVVVVCIIGLGLIFPFDALAKWVADEPQTLNVGVVVGLFLACVAVAIAVLRTEWGHMVIDEKGIYFHRPLARTKFIAWEDVRDWGIAHKRTRYSWVYDLYFSTVSLKPTRHGRNKKIPMTYKKAIYIRVEANDLPSLRRTGAISFCRQRLREDNKSAKNFIPMFISDLAGE